MASRIYAEVPTTARLTGDVDGLAVYLIGPSGMAEVVPGASSIPVADDPALSVTVTHAVVAHDCYSSAKAFRCVDRISP
ncbi:MAG TPA: hypothetical protein VGC40_03400 [Paenirhodobacter sp.]